MKLNLAESKILAEAGTSLIEKKDCYNNVYRLFINDFISKDLHPAYVYLKLAVGIDGRENAFLYTRHAVFINEKNEVVDPTLYQTYTNRGDGEGLNRLVEDDESYVLIQRFTHKEFRNFLAILYEKKHRTDAIGVLVNEPEAEANLKEKGHFII